MAANFQLTMAANFQKRWLPVMMADGYKFISDIGIGQRQWTSKVVVAGKCVPKTSHDKRLRYQTLILIDLQGLEYVLKETVQYMLILLSNKFNIYNPAPISHPPCDKIVHLKDIPHLFTKKDQEFFWLKGRVRVSNNNQPFWFMCCSNCNKRSSAGFDKIYQCVYCKYDCAKGTPRAKVHVQVEDHTGCVSANMIGETAETFLQCSGQKLMQIAALKNQAILNNIRASTTEEHMLYVKVINNNKRTVALKYDVRILVGGFTVEEKTAPRTCINKQPIKAYAQPMLSPTKPVYGRTNATHTCFQTNTVIASRNITDLRLVENIADQNWFDGLQTFMRYICHKSWLGGWFMPQKKSYFALQLPKGWWVFGLDLALHCDIDVYQFKFFLELIKEKVSFLPSKFWLSNG
ncbi:Metallophos domain-containing protein [Forsythia ovata]|uniref:Metallophos domain-containing protein n=1 Tax=Forsythia ovata TaxID=205694 RepID=A0ABD1RNU6_9LAMI